jgi:DNA-binding response OmpR family regulator
VASILISEVDPDVRRLLTVLVERQGHVAAVLRADVVVPPRSDLLIVDPVVRVGLEHLRLVRAFLPELPVLCLNPLPDGAGLLGRGPTTFLPKPFAPERLAEAIDHALSASASPV